MAGHKEGVHPLQTKDPGPCGGFGGLLTYGLDTLLQCADSGLSTVRCAGYLPTVSISRKTSPNEVG